MASRVGCAVSLGLAEVALTWRLGSYFWACVLGCVGPGFGPTIGSLAYKVGLKMDPKIGSKMGQIFGPRAHKKR